MTLEPIGILTLLAGLLVLYRGPAAGISVLTITCLLGAAAAMKLPGLGGASIQPPHVIVIFLIGAIALDPAFRTQALLSLTFPRPGFWLLTVFLYGAVTAVLLPRVFAEMIYVFSLSRMGTQVGIVVAPLAPLPSHITQVAYIWADVVCFASISAVIAQGGAFLIGRAMLAAAAVNLIFAFADLATYKTQASELLSFVRNANYRMLDDGEILGLKRIVGSFAEASVYGYVTLGFYAFCLNLWLQDLWAGITGTLAILLLATLLICTSTTAYVAFAASTLLLYAGCILRVMTGCATTRDGAFLVSVPLVLAIISLCIVLVPSASAALTEFLDVTIFYKLDTQSGIERSRWNEQAIQTFIDTAGLGAGLGSVRASSFPIAVLSNIGLIGLVPYLIFLAQVILGWKGSPNADAEAKLGRAAAHACVALLIAAFVSGGGVDLGLFFYIFAGIAAATGARAISKSDTRSSLVRAFHPGIVPSQPGALIGASLFSQLPRATRVIR